MKIIIKNLSKMENRGDYLYFPGTSSRKDKIFGFDLDQTLVVYKNGNNPIHHNKTDPHNYNFICKLSKLKELNEEYTIFIITNQSNISPEKTAFIENIWRDLEFIPHILIAHKKNHYRKPSNGFMYVIQGMLGKKPINSYYCGDAIGPSDEFIPYRWGSDDSLFAYNSDLSLVRPIDLFGTNYETPTTDFVMMMGNPGSYKTTFAKYLESNCGYVRFSQDECGELINFLSQIESGLRSGYKVVIDATFGNFKNRTPWIEMCQRIQKEMTIVWMCRCGRAFNAAREKPVIHFAYSTYTKNFADPEYEGMPYKLIKNY